MSRGGVHLGGLAEHVRARGGPVFPAVLGTPLSLTLSGNEITDAVRAAGLAGDGLSPEGSMGVWESTTNLVTNGGFETNTTGWAGRQGTETLTRDTGQAKFGAGSLKVDLGHTDAALEGVFHAFTGAAATVYTHSVWVKPDSGITVRVYAYDNVAGFVGGGSVAGDGETWTRLSVTTTTGAGAATFRVYVRVETSGNQSSKAFYVDGVQVEQQPLATPYVETNGSTASRSAADISLPVSGLLDETQGWVAFRIRYPWAHTSEPYQFPNLFNWADDGNNNLVLYYELSGNLLYGDRNLAGAGNSRTAAASWSAGDSKTIVFAWTATALLLSVDGGAFASTANSSIPTLSSGTAYLLRDRLSAALQPDADLFWFACGLGTLTDTDAANIHAWGNSDPSPGLFPTTADLTLIWKAINDQARSY